MSNLKLEELSSNWKKLQGTLQADKKPQPQNNGLKRKRPGKNPTTTTTTTTSAFKKPKLSPHRVRSHAPNATTRNMGLSASHPTSTPPPKEPPSAPRTLLSPTDPSDTLNTNIGRHPTHTPGKYLALDCEMVGCGPPPHTDNLLARASLVNYHGHLLYDSYVLPPAPMTRADVKDYRTFVSGITSEHLQPGVARPFAQVQAAVAELLDGRLLVGHALKNDLDVLLLAHPKRDVRDTARYAGFRARSGGKAPALRRLVREELGWEIQGGSHSSVEDARAAMAVFRKVRGAFEMEVGRRFGADRRVRGGKLGPGKGGQGEEDSSSVEELSGEEDGALLDGEEDDEVVNVDGRADGAARSTAKTKRKSKKKKRTKRK